VGLLSMAGTELWRNQPLGFDRIRSGRLLEAEGAVTQRGMAKKAGLGPSTSAGNGSCDGVTGRSPGMAERPCGVQRDCQGRSLVCGARGATTGSRETLLAPLVAQEGCGASGFTGGVE